MSTPKVVLVTGASSGFGAMTVRALADAKHVVYAGMRDIGGRNAEAADAARRYADEHGVTLRPIEMDVSDQASVNGAVAAVLAEALRVDVVIHNAGHMVIGPTEAFTPIPGLCRSRRRRRRGRVPGRRPGPPVVLSADRAPRSAQREQSRVTEIDWLVTT